jgi:hypothetical protein
MQEKPNLTASQTTRIASLLLHSAQDRLWPAIDFVLGDDNREVNDADMTRIFNALKALI